MQSMSEDFFIKYYKAEIEKLNKEFIYPSAEEALNYLSDSFEDDYLPSYKDERPKIIQSIYARRGQKEFRDSLRKRYGDKCMVTGCEILDVIEAAHINPYKGKYVVFNRHYNHLLSGCCTGKQKEQNRGRQDSGTLAVFYRLSFIPVLSSLQK